MASQSPQQLQGTSTQPRKKSTCCLSSIIFCSIGTLLVIVGLNLMHFNFNFNTSTEPAKIGDTITLNNISCTLRWANNITAPGFVTIDIKLVNNSQSEYHYYISDFVLKSSSGSIINPDGSGGGALVPGGSIQGTINFLIDEPHDTKLIWQPIGYSDDLTHLWNLGL
jgi:hypothetical protein